MRLDPWTIVLTAPNGSERRISLDGSFMLPNLPETPARVFVQAITEATTWRQDKEFRLRGRGPRGDAGMGWAWRIEEGV
jgi:hypothetical protein